MGQVSYLEDIQRKFEDLENAVWKNLDQLEVTGSDKLLKRIEAAFVETKKYLQTKIDAMPSTVLDAVERNSYLVKERIEAERLAEKKISALNSELEDATAHISSFEKNLVALEKQIGKTEKSNENLASQIATKNEIISKLRYTADILRRKLDLKDENIRRLEHQYAEFHEALRRQGIIVVDEKDRAEMDAAFRRL